ncbi:MAG: glycosyltransferase [Alphaproteobacteria bacterium]|nr:MAG: glycosyltransferase [Alphaproteobacteria bacterium]
MHDPVFTMTSAAPPPASPTAAALDTTPPAPGSGPQARRPHLLHVFPSFVPGGVPIRIATIINLLAGRYRHTVIAMDGRYECRTRIDPSCDVAVRPPPVTADPVRTVLRLRTALRDIAPDLLLTYNWGAIEWALANAPRPLCPHLHFESGFGPEEADGQLRRRALIRRLALHRTTSLVVPSQTLVEIATGLWHIPSHKVTYVPNGVDVAALAAGLSTADRSRFRKGENEVVVGTLAPLRREKNLARLIRAFARAGNDVPARLVIAGDGPERANLERTAQETGIAARVTFTGHVDDIVTVLGALDVFVLSSDTEQMPNSLLQAMAAALPVAATDVGDIRRIVAEDNRPFVVPRDDEAALATALRRVIDDRDLRTRLGALNRERVRNHYGMERMLARYRELYDTCLEASGDAGSAPHIGAGSRPGGQ